MAGSICKPIPCLARPLARWFFWLLGGLFVMCHTDRKTYSNEDHYLADESLTSSWPAYGRTHSEQRFSPLNDININNVNQLHLDWSVDLPDKGGLVSTPLVIEGIIYFTGTMNIVRALNAATGVKIWEYDPETGKNLGLRRISGWSHSRGISYYAGKIFLATWDGRLIALNARNGQPVWTVQTVDKDKWYNITGAPKAFKGKVLIGNGGSEAGPARGYVTAYDVETGQLAWRFYIVPGNPADGFENEAMRMAAKTWTGEWWKFGGGGNSWHGFTYDAELDQLYIGTGNGGPWNRQVRSPEGGDNLFLSSIVALDPDDGSYLWHYQTTPGESWDYNSNMDIVLADLTLQGKPVKTILHAPKNGFFYVIDRTNGRLISAKPFVETTWASHIDSLTGKPVEITGSRYEQDTAYITPSPHGGHSWHAMSYNPLTGLVYLPTIHDAEEFTVEGMDLEAIKNKPASAGIAVRLTGKAKKTRPYEGSLQAWNPVSQQQVWSIPQKDLWNAGTLTTAGHLVFQGRADGQFLAYNAINGDSLWSFNAGLGISAPPITYKIGGTQYLALLVGWGGAYAGVGEKNLGWDYGYHQRRLLVFSLTGRQVSPPIKPPHFPTPIDHPELTVNPKLASLGAGIYWKCGGCHGAKAVAKGMAPDLRASPLTLDTLTFRLVVKEGLKLAGGMPAYPDLTDEQVLGIFHYIRKEARAPGALPRQITQGQ